MRKGVSPVVATVLLIAIAVIAAVSVWAFIGPWTSSPSVPSTAQYSYTFDKAFKNSTNDGCWAMDLRNTGGRAIPANMIFEIFYQVNSTSTGKYINISTTWKSGETNKYNITDGTYVHNATAENRSLQTGYSYIMVVSSASTSSTQGYNDVTFTC